MFKPNTNSHHYKTLKGWTRSSEFDRSKLLSQIKECEGGSYKVKMEESDSWEMMTSPPQSGASEWLYLNNNGIPVYYWKKGQDGLTII